MTEECHEAQAKRSAQEEVVSDVPDRNACATPGTNGPANTGRTAAHEDLIDWDVKIEVLLPDLPKPFWPSSWKGAEGRS